MDFIFEDFLKVLIAVLVGGLIGMEREYHDKAAGFRTIIFICVGGTLFTIISQNFGGEHDPTRIAANIVSGVGFLGAGVILRDGGRVMGLTTASTIWLAAALGMGIGTGKYTLVGSALLVILVVLWLFPFLEHRIDNLREVKTYEVLIPFETDKLHELEILARNHKLRLQSQKQVKTCDEMLCIWEICGSPKNHQKLIDAILSDPQIREFKY